MLFRSLNALKLYKLLGVIVLSGFLCFYVGSINTIRLDLAGNKIGLYLPAYITSLLGILMMFAASNLMTKYNNPLSLTVRSIISFVGKNSYVILAFHMIVYTTLKILFLNLTIPYYISGIVRYILLWIVLFSIIYVVNNYCPWVISKNIKYQSKTSSKNDAHI